MRHYLVKPNWLGEQVWNKNKGIIVGSNRMCILHRVFKNNYSLMIGATLRNIDYVEVYEPRSGTWEEVSYNIFEHEYKYITSRQANKLIMMEELVR